MLLEVKVYEAKFLGMPQETIDGKLVRSEHAAVIPEIGELDADKGSDTYGKRVCKVGETYRLDEYMVRKFGGAFDMDKAKEVKGYVIDDGETEDEANALTPGQVKQREEEEKKAEEKRRKESEKEAEKAKENEEKVGNDTPKTSEPLAPKGKFAEGDEPKKESKK